MRKQSWFFLPLFLLWSLLKLQADPVDDFVNSRLETLKIPGLSLAVLRNGETILVKGYGFSNMEHKIPAKPETIYQSGSVGKQFTAAAAMLLVEEGKLGLEDPLTKYFPDSPASWKNITIRHLLTHTSGIPDYGSKDVDFRKDYTEEELLKVLKTLPLDFTPGERWKYSNSGYMLLGFVIRKGCGKFYGDFLQERIFQPAGMQTARIITERDLVPNRAAGYELKDGSLKNQEWVAPSLNTTADGSLYLSILDMAKWESALYKKQLLQESSYSAMWTPVKLNNGISYPYGFGWNMSFQRGHRIIQHSGHWQGFSTAICRYPESGLTVITLMNRDSINSLQIAHGIAGLMEVSLKHPQSLQPSSGPEADQRAAEFSDIWKAIAERRQDSRLATGLQHVVNSEFVQKDFADAQKETVSVAFIACDTAAAGAEMLGSAVAQFCYYAVKKKDGVDYVTVALTKEGKIADIFADDDYR